MLAAPGLVLAAALLLLSSLSGQTQELPGVEQETDRQTGESSRIARDTLSECNGLGHQDTGAAFDPPVAQNTEDESKFIQSANSGASERGDVAEEAVEAEGISCGMLENSAGSVMETYERAKAAAEEACERAKTTMTEEAKEDYEVCKERLSRETGELGAKMQAGANKP